MRRVLPIIFALGAIVRPAAGQLPADAAAVRHLLNRAAFGPRPGDVERILSMGVERYLETQLRPERLADTALTRSLAHLTVLDMSTEALREVFQADTRARRERQRRRANGDRGGMRPPAMRRYLQEFQQAVVARAVLSERQLFEVMVDFWTNHFNVFLNKGPVRYMAPAFLEQTIRPHALGRFEDLLVATARSPAMLVYLDNALSVAEGAEPPRLERLRQRRRQMAARPAQRARLDSVLQRLERQLPRGLNENYARELLELHTLGVDGGYTQQDVVEAARVLTGWSVRQQPGAVQFVFNAWAHDRGEKRVLGHTFPAGRGEDEGLELLHLLATHPSTRRFIGTKLCRRFVADDPPPSCVETAERAWIASDGDIAAIVRAILMSPDFWSPAYRGVKLKTPFEFVVSAARAVGGRPDSTLRLAQLVARLGQPVLQQPAPTGYAERGDAWMNSGALLHRFQVAIAIASGRAPGLLANHELIGEAATVDAITDGVNRALLGGAASEATVAAIRSEIADIPDLATQRMLAIGLALGSPDFQRQ